MRRQINLTKKEIDESSSASDEEEKKIPHIPFAMNFRLLDGEMMDLRLAFEQIMDEDGKINFHELYYNLDKREFRESEHVEYKLLYGILSKIMDYKELNFD